MVDTLDQSDNDASIASLSKRRRVWLLMVASTVGVAILGLLLVRRLVPLDLLQMHHEVGGYIIGVMGTIYAVILAFVVFVVWNQYQMANAAVVAEANSLGDLSRMTRRLPEPLQTQLRRRNQEEGRNKMQDSK